MTVKPSHASTFIKYDPIEKKINILKAAESEFVGEIVILLKLSAYTTDRVPVLRERTNFFVLEIK